MRELCLWVRTALWQWRAERFRRRIVLATADAEIAIWRRWKECC